MTFLGLIVHNVWRRRLRAVATAMQRASASLPFSRSGAVLAVSYDQRLTSAADRVVRLVDGRVDVG